MKFIKILNSDPVMENLTRKYGELSLKESRNYFDDLVSAIIGQLLSNKAADTIYKRVAALCAIGVEAHLNRTINSAALTAAGASGMSGASDMSGVTPQSILSVPDEALRAAGSSYGKIRCMKALAQAVVDKTVDLENIKQYNDEDVVRQLTVIKGIGRWTAEMFLIFSLAREDIFSLGDGGLNSAINRLYGNGGGALSKAEIKTITDKWQPYRSYASLYLWASLDNK